MKYFPLTIVGLIIFVIFLSLRVNWLEDRIDEQSSRPSITYYSTTGICVYDENGHLYQATPLSSMGMSGLVGCPDKAWSGNIITIDPKKLSPIK